MAKRDYLEGSGNVYADLGFADAEEKLAKAELARKIAEILEKRRLTQAQAAALLGVDQPKVSALLCGRLQRFSLEKLMQFLLLLGEDVAITIGPRRRGHSRVRGERQETSQRGRLSIAEAAPARAART
jgi:predicted XRE-type DNA-binding protein